MFVRFISRPESKTFLTPATDAKTASRADLQRPAKATHERHLVQLIQFHVPNGKLGMDIKWKLGKWCKKAIVVMHSTGRMLIRWECVLRQT